MRGGLLVAVDDLDQYRLAPRAAQDLEPDRQVRARAVLEDLAARPLSTDSYEIVTKTLGGA